MLVGNREIDSFIRNKDAKKLTHLTNQTQTTFHMSAGFENFVCFRSPTIVCERQNNFGRYN